MNYLCKSGILIFFIYLVSISGLYSKNLPFKGPYDSNLLGITSLISTKQSTLKCISYNTWGLPISLQGHQQWDRFRRMPDTLMDSSADILCLQETFHPVLRNAIVQKLRSEYYFSGDYRCNLPFAGLLKKDCQGGLMTFSKFPVLSEVFFEFPEYHGISIVEKIGSKGFLWTIIDMNGLNINVLNTHLYAGDDEFSETIRLRQIKYMVDILISNHEFLSNPTILMGDINTTHPDMSKLNSKYTASKLYPFLVNEINFVDSNPELTPDDYTYDGSKNYFIKDAQNKQKLDYCFYKNPIDVEILSLKSRSLTFNKNKLLSDHFGWSVTFAIKHENYQSRLADAFGYEKGLSGIE